MKNMVISVSKRILG